MAGTPTTAPRNPAPDFRCAAASLAREEPLVGTASTVRPWLLVENPGPWGVDAVADNRMPAAVKHELGQRSRATGVRVVLIRRHHRPARRSDPGLRVFAAWADAHRPWLESGTLHDPAELLDLDLDGLAGGRSPGLAEDHGPLFATCTHGRHDACCAERGRPVAAAFAEATPEAAWECSHIGGDRFAGNAVVLPHGIYYGRLDAASAGRVTVAHARGEMLLDHARGRAGLPMPVQVAELALRRELDERGLDAVRMVDRRRDADHTTVRFAIGERAWEVLVRTSADGAPQQLTCGADRLARPPRHEVLDLRPVDLA